MKPAPADQRLDVGWNWRAIAFWLAIAAGGFLRFYALGGVPAGLNSDEASSGVEALSILRTGMDRWGNHFPIWFPAWGSGMNALYTYIAIPVIAAFGLDVVTLRAIGAVFGLLTLPVAYCATRLYFGRKTALATLWLLALLPWHVMSSRWALDSNLVPFWFTLGLFTIGKALQAGGSWRVFAFLPWAISIYAYPVSMIPSVAAAIAILFFFRRTVAAGAGGWIAGGALALIVASPFLMFALKNQFHLAHLPLEDDLPFSVPLLPSTRLSQIQQSVPVTIFNNLIFFLNGYRDGAVWHQSVYFPPLTGAAPYLTLLGIAAAGWKCLKTRQPNVILIVVSTAIIPICLIPANLTRFNWFYIPSLMLVADFLLAFARDRKLFLYGSMLYLGTFLLLFYPYYFFRYNNEILSEDIYLRNGFRIGLEGALRGAVAQAAPTEPIFINVGTVHPYLYVLFYGLSDIESFQATKQVTIQDGVYHVSRFDRFAFERNGLPQGAAFTFVARSNDLPCASPERLDAGPVWAVGRCPAL